jgi:cytochrome c biogenesis protein CcmG, thiol:disulfide interchange protein DsbE
VTDHLSPRRRGRTALVSASIVGVVMVAFIALLATSETGRRESTSPLLGLPAPAAEGVTIGGDEFALDEWRGRWVVVNFFGTWCPPCIAEHPHLVEFHETHAGSGEVEVVSIAFNDTRDDIEAFFADYGGEWPVLAEGVDGQSVNSVAIRWGVTGLPESFLIAPDGVVVYKFTGGVTFDDLQLILSQARGLPPAEIAEELS